MAHGDRIPAPYFEDIVRDSFGGGVSRYFMLFEAASFIIRNSLLKVLREGLLEHFTDAMAADPYFGNQGLTHQALRARFD